VAIVPQLGHWRTPAAEELETSSGSTTSSLIPHRLQVRSPGIEAVRQYRQIGAIGSAVGASPGISAL